MYFNANVHIYFTITLKPNVTRVFIIIRQRKYRFTCMQDTFARARTRRKFVKRLYTIFPIVARAWPSNCISAFRAECTREQRYIAYKCLTVLVIWSSFEIVLIQNHRIKYIGLANFHTPIQHSSFTKQKRIRRYTERSKSSCAQDARKQKKSIWSLVIETNSVKNKQIKLSQIHSNEILYHNQLCST